MKTRKLGSRTFLIVLEIGDKVLESLNQAAEDLNVKTAFVNGIGAIQDPEIGYFDTDKKIYLKEQYTGSFEVLSLTGNIAIKDKKPFPHIHCILSDSEHKTMGGHLFSATVSVTLEVIITSYTNQATRTLDKKTGLYLL